MASLTALVRTVLSASGGTPVMPLLVSWSPDSSGVMYWAVRPPDGVAGYHSETISSRALTPRPRDRDGRCLSATRTWYRPGTDPSAQAGTAWAPARPARHRRLPKFPCRPSSLAGHSRTQPRKPAARVLGLLRRARNPGRWRYTPTR